ncbi:thiol:disulfide interchange protein DsbA/DsbL [Kitasatospora sp. NPDC057595]|uniref:thiol:disulfide interchange protein DsbA/DsbL n=1 Tax=unclassified Kitasatospora TaxID=2633591 RepID=UPI00368586D0
MKPILRTTLLLALAAGIAASPLQAAAANHRPPREGTPFSHLNTIQPVRESARTEALEFFWYDCGHSQALEEPLRAWTERHRSDVDLRRVPAIWQGSREEAVQRGHARLYYTLERLGEVDRLQTATFRAVHTERRDLTSEDTAAAWAQGQGVDQQRFRAAYRSTEVDRAVDEAARLFVRHGINELPTVIVQGEYRTSPTNAGGVEAMPEVMDHLVAQDQQRHPAHTLH